jgi:hypothetical protein
MARDHGAPLVRFGTLQPQPPVSLVLREGPASAEPPSMPGLGLPPELPERPPEPAFAPPVPVPAAPPPLLATPPAPPELLVPPVDASPPTMPPSARQVGMAVPMHLPAPSQESLSVQPLPSSHETPTPRKPYVHVPFEELHVPVPREQLPGGESQTVVAHGSPLQRPVAALQPVGQFASCEA